MNSKLSARDIELSFGKKKVLKGLNIDFPERQISALIGPSGCGKSTFLRAMNRMHDLIPEANLSGDILLDGESVYGKSNDVTEVRKKIGMVFQKPNPFPKSIYDNVAFGLKVRGIKGRKELDRIVEESLRHSYLWEEVKDELHNSALSLSGGQQQRLCIARAIAVEPEVLLMDEPCSALDPLSTSKIEDLMIELKKDFTIIIVTHNMQQAQRVADKTIFMYLGEIIEHGDTQQVFNAPQKELTGKYISGNFG